MEGFRKRAPDVLNRGVDFSAALAAGATVVSSNARGAVGVTIWDKAGADVTAGMSEAAQAAGALVIFTLKAGTAGEFYSIEVAAPTSDGELITVKTALQVD
jgi:hypothetical protein